MLNLLSSHDMPRIRSLLSGDLAAVRLAVILQMTLPGAPSIYYGDEIGMEGGNDPDCRRSFPAGADGRDEVLRAFYRAAVAARHGHPALRSDRVVVAGVTGAAVALARGGADDPTAAGETLLVAVNAGTERATLAVAVPALAGRRLVPVVASPGAGWDDVADVLVGADGSASPVLEARSGAVFAPR